MSWHYEEVLQSDFGRKKRERRVIKTSVQVSKEPLLKRVINIRHKLGAIVDHLYACLLSLRILILCIVIANGEYCV